MDSCLPKCSKHTKKDLDRLTDRIENVLNDPIAIKEYKEYLNETERHDLKLIVEFYEEINKILHTNKPPTDEDLKRLKSLLEDVDDFNFDIFKSSWTAQHKLYLLRSEAELLLEDNHKLFSEYLIKRSK